jgi:hypothetical protein
MFCVMVKLNKCCYWSPHCNYSHFLVAYHRVSSVYNGHCIYCILQLCVGDELPDKVCTECVHQVNVSYNFKLQCETTDMTLRQMLLKAEVRYCMCVYWGRYCWWLKSSGRYATSTVFGHLKWFISIVLVNQVFISHNTVVCNTTVKLS